MCNPACAEPSFGLYKALLGGWCAAVLVACMGLTGAMADEYTDVSRLVKAGQMSQALGLIEQHLSSKPRDPQMRFIKGVIFTETGRSADAITEFTSLTQDFPELPEPYNNLAVLYASQRQLDKARELLEMAVRTNPAYATAHENLGDVHAQLAQQSYARSQQLDASQPSLAPKLALVQQLVTLTTRGAIAPRP